jgi:hypothetical protein
MIKFDIEIQELLQDFINLIDLKEYLIYGSCAYVFYTNENIPISDVDIIVSKKNFNQIITKLKNSDLYSVFPFEKTIHCNAKFINGNDGKAFDISIDCYEDYFLPMGINMNKFEMGEGNFGLKFVKREDLIEIYTKSQIDHSKSIEYERKVNRLLNHHN